MSNIKKKTSDDYIYKQKRGYNGIEDAPTPVSWYNELVEEINNLDYNRSELKVDTISLLDPSLGVITFRDDIESVNNATFAAINTGYLFTDKIDTTSENITQLTSITTPVTGTVNLMRIVTVSSTLTAGSSVEFTLNHANIAPSSFLITSLNYNGNGVPVINLKNQTNGSVVIRITNVGTAALNNIIIINILKIK
jgi:hypothetical protein